MMRLAGNPQSLSPWQQAARLHFSLTLNSGWLPTYIVFSAVGSGNGLSVMTSPITCWQQRNGSARR
jgi:hypothetical protein